MISSPYLILEQLVREERFDEAADFCREDVRREQDPYLWKTQLGYVYFLNEGDDDAYHNKAPSIFEDLVHKYPLDTNSNFWLGYIYDIVCHDATESTKRLQEALRLEPGHPYANLVLAGIVSTRESYALLERALERQPNNIRALRQLSVAYLAINDVARVKNLLTRIISVEPYIENTYGIMNTYINDVLTGATHKEKWRTGALETLETMDMPPPRR